MDQSANHLDYLDSDFSDDFLTLNVEGGVIPLARSSSEQGSAGSSSTRKNSSNGSLKDDAIIHK